jgi:arylsulfatase A
VPGTDRANSAWATWYSKLQVALPLIHNTTVIEQPVNLNTLEQRYVQKASEFIHASANAKKPFLVYLAWSHVHVPDFVNPSFCNSSARGRFGDAMEEMDNHIGSVMQVLKDADVEDNTLVFFTSDNGPWLK